MWKPLKVSWGGGQSHLLFGNIFASCALNLGQFKFRGPNSFVKKKKKKKASRRGYTTPLSSNSPRVGSSEEDGVHILKEGIDSDFLKTLEVLLPAGHKESCAWRSGLGIFW